MYNINNLKEIHYVVNFTIGVLKCNGTCLIKFCISITEVEAIKFKQQLCNKQVLRNGVL